VLKTVVVSAADDNYVHLLLDLLASLAPYRGDLVTTVAVLDLGLSDSNRSKVAELADVIRTPDWDIDLPPEVKAAKPHVRALTARPFLPDYFPGHDVVMWLDADVWVQTDIALQGYVQGSAAVGLALTPMQHPNYAFPLNTIRWRLNALRSMFGDGAADLYLLNRYYNAGVFAATPGHPFWRAWAANLTEGLARIRYEMITDQNQLNFTLWTGGYDVCNLPAIFNWAAHLCLPQVNLTTGLLEEPGPLARPIGIMHLAAQTWRSEINVGLEGLSEPLDLRFGSALRIRAHVSGTSQAEQERVR
jgi:hypothetical protein